MNSKENCFFLFAKHKFSTTLHNKNSYNQPFFCIVLKSGKLVVETLQNTVDALKQQLMEKDTQIAGLTAALSDAQQVQQQLSSALATSQETQKQLTDALATAQALHAGTIQMQQQKAQQTQPELPQDAPVVDVAEPEQDHSPAEEKTEVQETQVATPEQEGEKKGAMVKEVQERPLKRGFWAKLFGRKYTGSF